MLLGGALTAVVCAHWPLRRRAGAAMLFCVFCFDGFTIAFGLSRTLALSMAALVRAGACDMVSVIVRHTQVQIRTPGDMRGRVSAVNMVFIGASNEVGQFDPGITAQWFGTVPAVVLGGVGTMCLLDAALCEQVSRPVLLTRRSTPPAQPAGAGRLRTGARTVKLKKDSPIRGVAQPG